MPLGVFGRETGELDETDDLVSRKRRTDEDFLTKSLQNPLCWNEVMVWGPR